MRSQRNEMMVWRDQPSHNDHVWAFIYFCRRQGDNVSTLHNGDGTMDVLVRRSREDES